MEKERKIAKVSKKMIMRMEAHRVKKDRQF